MRELRRLREESGRTPDEAAASLDISKSTLYRIENGRASIHPDILEAMLDLYGVHSPEHDALLQLGRDSRRRGWWTPYKDVFTGSYIGLESAASAIRSASQSVPGLFQSTDYARAVIAETGPWLAPADIDRRAEARAARQGLVLGGDDPPEIHAILDEAALRRQVGGPAVMTRQLEALGKAGAQPRVTIQVVPFSAGASAGMAGDFVMLAFPDPEDEPVGYVEGLFGDIYMESAEGLDRYRLAWTNLLSRALSPAQSAEMISRIGREQT